MSKLKIVVLAAVAVAAFWPGSASAASFRGVVVAKHHGTMLVATPNGLVRAVAGRASIGSRVVGARVVGRAARARIRGVVVEQLGTTVFLSSNRHLVALRSGGRAPAPGTVVDTTVVVKADGELEEQDEDEVGEHGDRLQIQAVVSAVGAGTVTLTVGTQSLTVKLPAGLTLPQSIVGQTVTVEVSLSQNDDGDDDGHHRGRGGGEDDDD